MRTLFWTTLVLGLCFITPLHAQEGPPDPPVERQVIVMFETDAAALPNGATRAEIGQAQLPGQVKGLLQRAGARRMAKGFPDFRRADTLRVLENGRTYRVPDYTNLFVVTLPPNANRDSVVARLNRMSEWVKYAEKNQRPAPRLSSGNRSHTVSSISQNGTNEVIPFFQPGPPTAIDWRSTPHIVTRTEHRSFGYWTQMGVASKTLVSTASGSGATRTGLRMGARLSISAS